MSTEFKKYQRKGLIELRPVMEDGKVVEREIVSK